MTTRKADKPIKALEEQSYEELVESLTKQQKLIIDGVATKLPDKGEKIKNSIEYIQKLIADYPNKHPVGDLEKHFGTMTIKQDATMADASPTISSNVTENMAMETIKTENTNINNINNNNNNNIYDKTKKEKPITKKEIVPSGTTDSTDEMTIDFSPTARPIIKKLYDITDNPEVNKKQKDHLDLFVRGRRGAKLDEKKGYKGVVALGLEEAIALRDAWRLQKNNKSGSQGDEDERPAKFEAITKGEGEEQEDEEMRDQGLTMEEMEGEETEGKIIRKKEGDNNNNNDDNENNNENNKGRKQSAGKKKQIQKQQQPVWDVDDDMKQILDMIPAEYKQPQQR